MRFLKIFKKRPLTRLELKAHSKNSKFRIRASRTSGINAAVHPLRGLTFNTKHGLRASKTFKGLTLGFQRGNSIVRGRWSSENGLLNLNLSKSGLTLSSKSKYGAYNISKPNRSSFKFAGIQLRGRKAAGPALIFTILTLVPTLIKSIFSLAASLIYALSFILMLLINILIILLRFVRVIYDSILLITIDIPKQLANNLFQKEIFDFSGKSEIKIDKEQLLSSDLDTIAIFKKRLETYGREYSEITILEKIIKSFLAFLGLNLISIGLIIMLLGITSANELSINELILMVILSICLVIGGRFAFKPLIRIRRHKEDDEFKEILR
jgi:hypothetical protein